MGLTPQCSIDAVCINQADNGEKEHQVCRMNRIFLAAERVLVWLENTSNDSDLAIDGIPASNKKLQYINKRLSLDMGEAFAFILQRLSLPGGTDPI